MSAPQMSEVQWLLAETLAKDLANRRVSHNLVRQAMTYTTAQHNAAQSEARRLVNWLERLTQLGATFASGRTDTTETERRNLKDTLTPSLVKYPGENWGLILAWTARLMLYHTAQSAAAQPPSNRRPSFTNRR